MLRDQASPLDIWQAAQKSGMFSQGLDRKSLGENHEKQSAILYQIIVIGKAVKRLSSEFRSQHPEVPWKDIAGMRDVVAHQYDRVVLDDLWSVVVSDMPELMAMIEPLLSAS